MSEPKPFASLSSGLLARKGAAKPAMRPQGFGQMGMGMEDLGWNDMGYAPPAPAEPCPAYEDDIPERAPSKISALTPAPKTGEEPEAIFDESEEDFVPPPVVEQQRAIEASFAAAEEQETAEDIQVPLRKPKAKAADIVALPARPRQQPGVKGKAAFTLRLDSDRHLKLRLACAVTHRSAQQIVSEALDDFLDSLPELDAMAGQVPARLGKPS